jgi:hypothetical protein
MSTLTNSFYVSSEIITTKLSSVKKFLLRILTKIQEGQIRRARRMIENKTYPF